MEKTVSFQLDKVDHGPTKAPKTFKLKTGQLTARPGRQLFTKLSVAFGKT